MTKEPDLRRLKLRMTRMKKWSMARMVMEMKVKRTKAMPELFFVPLLLF